MEKRIRQYIALIAAAAAYYILHEGAHLLTALSMGVFKKINLLGLGIQIDVENTLMSDAQMGIFCLSGAAATFLCGWLLVLLCKKICGAKSMLLRAAAWYITLTMLLLDPLYLSVLCGFFGGGDMNGIALFLPEVSARLLFGCVGIFDLFVVIRYIYPSYHRSFAESA